MRGLVATVTVALLIGAPLLAIMLVLPVMLIMGVGPYRTEQARREVRHRRRALERQYPATFLTGGAVRASQAQWGPSFDHSVWPAGVHTTADAASSQFRTTA